MKLFEFFGKTDVKTKDLERDSSKQTLDNLYYYMLEHDRLHKDYFIPLAKKIKKESKLGSPDKSNQIKEFMPMVEKGCKEYYIKNKVPGKFENVFTTEIKQELCEKLYDHYYEDIIKDNYKLG